MSEFRGIAAAWAAACAALSAAAAPPALAGEEALQCPLGRDYFVYAPKEIDPNRTYWLVVGVHAHGGKGKGAAGMSRWVSKGNVIAVGPSFPNNGYQFLGKDSDKQLIWIFQALRKKYKLHEKMFLYGFSGGSQFSHRFAMKYPNLVAGCASHSGGSWGPANPAARGVAFAVSTGEDDKTRLTGAKRFFEDLAKGGFHFKARVWPGVGHGMSPGARQITEECWTLATTGMYPGQKEIVAAEIAAIDQLVQAGGYADALARLGRLSAGKLPAPTGPAKPDEHTTVWRSKLENGYGWQESHPGRAAFGKMARQHVEALTRPRMAAIEEAGLAKVAEIEKSKPEDAGEQLPELARQFRGAPKTSRAIELLRRKPAAAPGPTTAPTSPAGAPDDPEAQAKKRLALADTYLAAGLKNKAVEILRSIVKDFPQTPAAAKAREKLKQLAPGS